MYRNFMTYIATPFLLSIFFCISPVLVSICFAETYVWDDLTVPFTQTFRFSSTRSSIVQITISPEILTKSDRVHIFCRIANKKPSLRPYMVVNGNRAAFYYLGGNGIVRIKSDHLKIGKNELLFSEQSTTGDVIFIHEMQYQQP